MVGSSLPFFDSAHQHFLLVGTRCADFLREGAVKGLAGFHPSGLVAHLLILVYMAVLDGKIHIARQAFCQRNERRLVDHALAMMLITGQTNVAV